MSPNDVRNAFEGFRNELDEHHDRRERLIKASRDITNISKKTIFLLHRLAQDFSSTDPAQYAAACKEASIKGRSKLKEVKQIYATLKAQGDLEGEERYWRYQRQVSPGLQEYIEALSFAWFLEFGRLITVQEVQETLVDDDGVPIFTLTTSDYLLGVSDLFGELMRYAISGFGRLGGRSRANEVCSFVRDCKADFERFTPYIWELNKKQAVTAQSLTKMEDAAYAVAIRASEYDLTPDELDKFVNDFLAYSEQEHDKDPSMRMN